MRKLLGVVGGLCLAAAVYLDFIQLEAGNADFGGSERNSNLLTQGIDRSRSV